MSTEFRMRSSVAFACLALVLASPSLFAGDHEAPHWSYSGEEGPEHWGEISEQYRMCSEGRNQSPIDLIADLDADLPELVFDYKGSPLREINNGHTIQQNVQPGGFLTISGFGKRYELKQFHFHSPSEHTIGGRSFAMELHFVHVNEAGGLGVLGVMIDEGDEHPVLNKLWAMMPEHAGETSEQAIGIEEIGLLPPTREYFTYNGSLTTPPCSEGVVWMVLKNPIEASVEQIARFKERMGPATNRLVQPHNARLILD